MGKDSVKNLVGQPIFKQIINLIPKDKFDKLITIFFLHVCLISCQPSSDKYNHFTPERRHVLNKMGEFFDETIRDNFPAETDSLSYLYFQKCFGQTGGSVILELDRVKLMEINKMLFKDQNYYFFFARYIYMGKEPPPGYTSPVDSVPTVRTFGTRKPKNTITPVLNRNGYIKVVPDDNPAIKQTKEDIKAAGDLSITIFLINVMHNNVRQVSQPHVKELCAVVFWQYLCLIGGIDLEMRKPLCEQYDYL